MNLNGVIPTNIGDLSALKTLMLNKNRITGEIPETISFISSLEDLDLSDNMITGTLPAQLGSLAKLRWFKIQNTLIKGQVPRSYCNLVKGPPYGVLQGLWINQCGGLSCYPGCMESGSSGSGVLSHDPALQICGQTGAGAAPQHLIVQQTDDQQTVTIAAAVAGGVIGLVCIIGIVCLLLRAKRKRESESTKVVVNLNSDGSKQVPTKGQKDRLASQKFQPQRRQTAATNNMTKDQDMDHDVDQVQDYNEDEEVGNPMFTTRSAQDNPKPMLKPLPLGSKLGAQKSALSGLQMQIELQNQSAPEYTPDDSNKMAMQGSGAAPFQLKRFTLKPKLAGNTGGGGGGGDGGAAPPALGMSSMRPPAAQSGGTRPNGAETPETGEEGSGSEGNSDIGSDDGESQGSDTRMQPSGEQRFMMGMNPMAGRNRPTMPPITAMGGGDQQSERRQTGAPRGPIVARAPEQHQNRRTSNVPGNISIRPEMQEAAMAQAKRFNLLQQPPRPPPAPPAPPTRR